MKLNFKLYFLLLMLCSFVMACDDEGEESMSWKPGSGLHIVGPGEVVAGEESEYYVDAFTIKENYTWTLDGATITPERSGEFVMLTFDAPGDHTLTVTNGKLTGTMEIAVGE
jgi:hypothetical protein